MKDVKQQRHLSKTQLKALSSYLLDISKTIILVILLGILFPQNNASISIINGLTGFFICVIFFMTGIILIKETPNYVDLK